VIQELRTGGAERVVVSLCRELAGRGHQVTVIAAPGELEAELDGFLAAPRYDIDIVGRRITRLPKVTGQIRGAVRDFAPDLVHAHNPVIGFVTALGARGRRALVSVHGMPDDDWRTGTRLLRLSRLPVVACGPGVADGLAEWHCQPVATIVNGVSAPPPAADRSRALSEWGLPPTARIVLVVGRLQKQKNQQLAIRAIAALPPDVALVLVGEGADEPMLRQLARDLDLDRRVVFAGRRPGRPLMAVADVVCLPSLSEGMPLVGVEAMLSGCPLVVTDVRGNRDLVDDGRTGLVVPPEDPQALAGAFDRLLADPGLANKLADGAAQTASLLSEAAMVDAYLDLYDRLAP